MVEIIILSLLVLMLVIKAYNYIKTENANRPYVTIPFKESLDLVNVPVVTFTNNGHKVSLMLDTGSDLSYIDSKALEHLRISDKRDCAMNIVGAGGGTSSTKKVTLSLQYKDIIFDEEFFVMELRDTMDNAFGKKIKVHGILGNSFFTKYKYKIDYKTLVAQA